LYHEHRYKDGKILFAAGGEYLDGTANAEAHGIVDIGKTGKVFAGIADHKGIIISTVGEFLDIGKYHAGVFVSVKSDELKSGEFPIPFGGEREVLLSLGYEGSAKFFYRGSGKFHSFNGFIRFGEGERRRYTPAAFYNDRRDLGEFTLRFAGQEKADIPLQPQNTHLSEQGTLAIAPAFMRTPSVNRQSVDAFYTLKNRVIAGYKLSRTDAKGLIEFSHVPSLGFNAGPAKIILSYDTNKKHLSAFASFRHKMK